MNPISEPDELLEAECNAQGLYGLPEDAAALLAGGARDGCAAAAPGGSSAPGTGSRGYDERTDPPAIG